jgi:hypothetical protein
MVSVLKDTLELMKLSEELSKSETIDLETHLAIISYADDYLEENLRPRKNRLKREAQTPKEVSNTEPGAGV